MPRKRKTPWLDLFLALFLFIYCWGTFLFMVSVEGFSRTLIALGPIGLIIWVLVPIYFTYGVYKYNKKYFDKFFEK